MIVLAVKNKQVSDETRKELMQEKICRDKFENIMAGTDMPLVKEKFETNR